MYLVFRAQKVMTQCKMFVIFNAYNYVYVLQPSLIDCCKGSRDDDRTHSERNLAEWRL